MNVNAKSNADDIAGTRSKNCVPNWLKPKTRLRRIKLLQKSAKPVQRRLSNKRLETGASAPVFFYQSHYNVNMISSTDLVLVCLLPTPRDIEIARLLGWYRIPLRTAPKVVSVDYLAFYQPGSFGERGGQIEFVAPVRGHELATRAELLKDEADHPRANEEYFKIQIGPLERLSRPIIAEKWRRITFLYTTGEYLLKAKILNDLVVQSDERALLWKSLRERAEQDQQYKVDVPDDIDPAVLIALLGIKELGAEFEAKEQDDSARPN